MSTETPDFVFKYADSDSLREEIAEWYTYSEEPEYLWNQNAFKESFQTIYGDEKLWKDLSIVEKRTHLNRLLNQTENKNKTARDSACRSILYISQGNSKQDKCFEK